MNMLEEMQRVRYALEGEGFPDACKYLDSIMEKGETPYIIASNLVECDKPKVFPGFLVEYITALYELEIEDGNHYAMNDLGARYYGGDRGFEQDFGKAMDLYHMAAENGNRQAQENLGYCYYYGRDGKPDYKKAFHYFALGAFDGHPISLYKIGDMYKNGYYVEKNPKEAFIIYNHCLQTMPDDASKYVSGPVHLRLGDMCLNGVGTEQDPQQALLHFNLAEIMLFQMVKDGDVMYKKSLRGAIEGQKKAREMLAKQMPEDEWTFDD